MNTHDKEKEIVDIQKTLSCIISEKSFAKR